jgi:hypothetical protein
MRTARTISCQKHERELAHAVFSSCCGQHHYLYPCYWQWYNETAWQRIHKRFKQWIRTMEYGHFHHPVLGWSIASRSKQPSQSPLMIGYDDGKKHTLTWLEG